MLIVRGLVAGLLAAVTFQQAALVLLGYVRLIPPPSLGLKPGPGQFLPDLASAALWGAFWGAILACLLPRPRRGRGYWTAGVLLGAILPTLATLGTVAFGGDTLDASAGASAAVQGLVNGAWGLGVAFFLILV